MKNLDIKIGLIFYTILIFGLLAFFGCKHIEKKERKENEQIKQEVEQMLDFPNIAKITIKI